MWLEQEEFRRCHGLEAAGYPRSAGEQARAVCRSIGHRVIWIKRIFLRMGDNHIRRQLTDERGQAIQRGGVNIKRIVTQVEADKGCAQHLRSPLRLRMT